MSEPEFFSWADPARGYPRPQLRRHGWRSLNGLWRFATDVDGRFEHPRDVRWNAEIRVPFSPETAASGIGSTSFCRACWYASDVDLPRLAEGERFILHFGAVDYRAWVYIDDVFVGVHEGGYTPFAIEIASASGPGRHRIAVRVEDDPHDLAKPRGKQDWKLEPHSIWYPRTTGIWQTVWLERAPSARIGSVRFTPSLERWQLGFEANVSGELGRATKLAVRMRAGERILADDVYGVVAGEVSREIGLSDPGVDDSRNELLWSPAHPALIDVELTLLTDRGEAIDTVQSYAALRSVAVQGDRFLLNGRPLELRMVLDQGYWPESGMTPPDDASIRRDVELAKAMGFNGVRKHQKVEDPRYLYWADRLGLMVWEEMPSAYRFTRSSVERLTREWMQVIARDASHPCIVAWVPFNESWGVPNLPDNAHERHWVRAVYELTKTLDPSRPVVGNDGWESVATDIVGIHDYDHEPRRIAVRYGADTEPARVLRRERPGGRLLLVEPHQNEHPIVLSEFGGIALGSRSGIWGYSHCETPDELARRYTALIRTVRSLGMLCGFCYTQFSDTYQEANGLLHADRTPKVPLRTLAAAMVPAQPASNPPDRPLPGVVISTK